MADTFTAGYKIAVIIPAFNEEHNVREVLNKLRMWRQTDFHNRPIIVVNDGSTDATKASAKTQWSEVIDSQGSKKNAGKGTAFIAGVRHAVEKYKPDIILMLDADLVALNHENIDYMIKKLIGSKNDMVVAKSFEPNMRELDWRYSGQRAIRTAALRPLLNGNKRWITMLSHGYGLETALNQLIKKTQVLSKPLFAALDAHRKNSLERQHEEILFITEVADQRNRLVDIRKEQLKKAREARRQVNALPKKPLGFH
ncbi:MAG TPA: glycosyltransferase family 2 protein [archaeon]|nr:glycosyltransferase family 2 protein [archaeon]